MTNWAHLPVVAKWTMSILMLLGRLEIFSVLVLFTPWAWKK
jgi:trk system potassium uptake protein TrkH